MHIWLLNAVSVKKLVVCVNRYVHGLFYSDRWRITISYVYVCRFIRITIHNIHYAPFIKSKKWVPWWPTETKK